VRVALINVLEEEVSAFIGALPYERNEHRRDQRNGHYTRDLETSMGQIADLPVPRTRHGYHTQVFDLCWLLGTSVREIGDMDPYVLSCCTVYRLWHQDESLTSKTNEQVNARLTA